MAPVDAFPCAFSFISAREMNPSVALCWVGALLTITTVAGRGVAVIDDSERLCTLSEAKTGWVSASFNLEGCVILNGTGSVVTDADAELLASELGKSSTLRSLLLEDSGVSDAAAAKLARALASHNSLLVLNLAGNEISAGAADALVELIETNQKLSVLDLQRNKLMSAGVSLHLPQPPNPVTSLVHPSPRLLTWPDQWYAEWQSTISLSIQSDTATHSARWPC